MVVCLISVPREDELSPTTHRNDNMLIVTLMLMALMMMLMLMMHGEVNVNDILNDGNDDSAINLGGSEGEDNVGEISWKGGVMKISHLHHR